MPVRLDEYPVHQVPLSMAHMASSDRNAYDRCYLNAHDRTGDVFLITGLGLYPNLGVIDAYATVTRGDRQVTVRMSDALGDDRMAQQVGPYRIEVLDPLHELRVVCDADDHGIGFDLHWRGSYPATEEPAHVFRQGGRVILDACRFAQVGTWEGTLRVDGDELAVTPDVWVGTRDRSWGIRPVGEAEPPGRASAEPDPDFGFWWVYVPLRFDDHMLVIILQEDGHGHRIMNEAVRVWPESSGRPVEQLGWPEVEVRYRPGTRFPTGARIHLAERGKPLVLDVEVLGSTPLTQGSGYGGDQTWSHGQWKGRNWIERVEVDLSAPDVAATVPFGIIDHVGRAEYQGQVGWGLFEHASFGLHAPSGFTGWDSVG